MFRWCLDSLVSFLVAMRILPQDYIMRDNLAIDFSLSTDVKKSKIIHEIFQKEHLSELLKLSAPSTN